MSDRKRFIGRETELQFLENKYAENRGQLIVLYGRRRVGKTETLREFCKGKPHVFFSCTQTTDRNRYSGKIFLPPNILQNLPTGNRRSGLFWNCLSARKKSWWLSMSFHICAGIIAVFLRFCSTCGMPS